MTQKKKQMATWKRVLVIGFLGMIFFAVLMDSIETPKEDLPVLLLMLAVLALLIVWQVKKILPAKHKAVKREAENSKATVHTSQEPHTQTYTASVGVTGGRQLQYRLAGVTFQGRQKWLRKIAQKQKEFEYVFCELEPYEWKGEPACRVLAYLKDDGEGVDIGNIPAEAAAKVCSLIDSVVEVEVEVYGGPEYEGDKKSYGAEVTITVE